MTSSGYRSRARIPAGFAILIFTAVLVLPQACARAESTFGRSYASARIYALGYRFAGIIPDQLTDLTLNPARAWDAESLTINYGFRNPYGQSLPFPVSDQNLEPTFRSMNISGSNELRFFGAGAWGWKWAVDTEWELDHEDRCNQSDINPYERYGDGGFTQQLGEDCRILDDNFFRLEIASAKRISDRTVLGFRAGGTYRYDNYKRRDRWVRNVYYYSAATGGYVQDRGWSNDWLDNSAAKLYTGHIEAGMTWNETGELVVRGGYARGTFTNDEYGLSIDSGYDRYTGELDDYRYRLNEFQEDREGDMWQLAVLARKKYAGGFVILASGRYERGSFECGWRKDFMHYSWGGFKEIQIEDRIIFPGEGEQSRSEAVFSMGKTYSLEPRIDITPGAYVSYKKERFEERGTADFYSFMDYQGDIKLIKSIIPLEFEHSISKTSLAFPLAMEFRPASFFHFYSGFGVTFTWNRHVRDNSILLYYLDSEDPQIPENTQNTDNWFDSGYYASLGFSLRYRDKLFLDMYTGSDIVPQRITSYFIDLRYVF